jgi:hypothetical protein
MSRVEHTKAESVAQQFDNMWAALKKNQDLRGIDVSQLIWSHVETTNYKPSAENKSAVVENCNQWIDGVSRVYLRLEADLIRLASGEFSYDEMAEFEGKLEIAFFEETGFEFRTHLPIRNTFCSLIARTDAVDTDDRYDQMNAASYLDHDISGIEFTSFSKFKNAKFVMSQAPFVFEGMTNQKFADHEAQWCALLRMAFLKWIGVFCVCIDRMGGEVGVRPKEFNLAKLVDHIARSMVFRFRTLEKTLEGLEINFEVEEGTDATLFGREPLLYLVIMNILKNAPKIMEERSLPSERQKVSMSLFEREEVLFLHYEDEAGGLDINQLLASAVHKIRHAVKAGAKNELTPTLSVIQGGAFQASQQLTLQSVCDLVFEEYVSARSGGSGLGLREAKDLLSQHGAYIQATPTLKNGTQFLIAIPKKAISAEDRDRIIHNAMVELDEKATKALGIAG